MSLTVQDHGHFSLSKLGWFLLALWAIVALLATASAALSTGQWFVSVVIGAGHLLLGSSLYVFETWQRRLSKQRMLISIASAVYAGCFILCFRLVSSLSSGSFSIQNIDLVLVIGITIAMFSITYLRWNRTEKQVREK
jgi:uncharacterized membrane protein YidH (DUF202 family)